MIGVFADIINADLDDKGGKLHVKYSLDFNNDFISNNEFYIDIKAKKREIHSSTFPIHRMVLKMLPEYSWERILSTT